MNQFTHQDEPEQEPTFEDALAEMTAEEETIPGIIIMHGLSNLSDENLETLKPVWANLDPTYRKILLQMLVDVSESHYELNYDALGWHNIEQEDPILRQAAIELLWEDESLDLMNELIRMVQTDPHEQVRAEAARALGRFVLLGELGDLPEQEALRVQNTLIKILQDQSTLLSIRCNALVSIANCTRSEIEGFIRDAYQQEGSELQMSAIVAMGHSCDTDLWGDEILEQLDKDDDLELSRYAARAAGELQLQEAIPSLIELLNTENRGLQEALIWALGEIGGNEAVRVLGILAEGAEDAEDVELLDLIDEALGNASIIGGDIVSDLGMEYD